MATPAPSVVLDVGAMLPPPAPTAQFTVTPATGLVLASRAITESGAMSAWPAGAA
jgi:hypothetical protein